MIDNINYRENLGKLIKQQRLALSLTLQKLAKKSRISASHLGRIERGERFPSGYVLRRIAKPLGYGEKELFILAGYISPEPSKEETSLNYYRGLDPYIARILSQESVEVQRSVAGILSILKIIAKYK